ncbi:MAG: hypothetical protein MUC50_23405 [Myxococcota bacterium]|nr:hypothetical protein [Myxococcota bacterium]
MHLRLAPRDPSHPSFDNDTHRPSYLIEGRLHLRVGFGMERDILCFSGHKCKGCGCVVGALHEPGCDEEQCPACGERVTACDCWYGPSRRY